jgi:sporulation protein YlmC with PRC-barrel domain
MAKTKYLISALFLAFGVMVTNALGGEQTGMGMGKPFVWSGVTRNYVWNPQGEVLGRVSDLVIDSHGNTTFVVVSIPGILGFHGKNVAVPFDSFGYDREKHRVVLDIQRDRLFSAPAFTNRSLYNEKWVENMYRYFGKAPYWTEGELVEKGIKPPEDPMDYDRTHNPLGYRPGL